DSGIRGKVFDPGHALIPGAEVKVGSGTSSKSLLTDGNGGFSILLPPGNYTLEFRADGFDPGSENVTVVAGEFARLEIVLHPSTATATVTVVTTDAVGYRTEALRSATKTLTGLRDIPQSITVVSGQQIKDQSMASIADVINYVPGVTSHQGENNRDQMVITGNSS